MADNLLDKASILLTPTAYDNGRMLSVKPNENLYSSELVTNGDFATDSDWIKEVGWNISNGSLNASAVTNQAYQLNTGIVTNKTYKVTYTISNYVSGSVRIELGGFNVSVGAERSANGTYTEYIVALGNDAILFDGIISFTGSIDNVSVVEDLSGDFNFERNSAATRVNAQGLVENVQIISPELVSNGNFSQIGTEEVSNGDFSQEGSELVTNGDFSVDSNWNKGTGWSISGGKASCDGSQTSNSLFFQNIGSLANKTVKFSFTLSNYVSGQINTAFFSASGTTSYVASANGDYTFYIDVASGHNGNTGFTANSDFIGSIDNVSVKEVGQNWTLGTGWSIGDNEVSRTAQSGSTSTYQSVSFTANKSYKITYDLDISGGSFLLRIGGGTLIDTTIRTTSGTYTEYIVANSGNNVLNLRAVNGAFTGSITNISVKEVGQDWTLGAGWSVDQANSKVAFNDASNGDIRTSSIFTSNKKYQIKLTVGDLTSGTAFFGIGDGNAANLVTYDNYSNGDYSFEVTAPNGSELRIYATTSSGSSFSITNISVKEITDDTNIPRINYEGFSYQDSLGIEEIVNGDFSVDSDWNKEAGWTISGGTANRTNTGTYTALQQNILTIGKKYKVSIQIKSISSGSIFGIRLGTNYILQGVLSSEGVYTGIGVASNATLSIMGDPSFTGSIDNVSVKEYLGQEVVPDSGCGSWLLEKQSTNLATYSEDFSNSYWTKTGASLSSSFASPSGDLSAFKLVEDTSTGVHGLTAVVSGLTIGNTHTISIYAKAGENNYMYMRFRYAGNTNVMFDLVNGTIGVSGSNVLSKSIEPMTNGYYKCTITASAPTSTEGFRIYSSSNGTDISYTGDGTSGIYIWGAQVEQKYATSYIPTNGATNTRLQDIANNSGNSSLINSTEGVLYAEISALANDGTNRYLTLTNGTSNERVALLFSANTNELRAIIFSSTQSINISFTTSSVDVLDYNKLAIRYKSGGYAFYVNGNLIGTNTSSSIFTSNTLNELSFDVGSGSLPFYGKAKALAVFPILTDAELQSLTTI